jgi:hypothetical protein
MRIEEIKNLLEADLICGEEFLAEEMQSGCGSDLMSDVLAFGGGHGCVLVTGLVNPQVIRTAEMMDIGCIVFGRGKRPSDDMSQMACQRGIALMSTRFGMLGACGRLFAAGLQEGDSHV